MVDVLAGKAAGQSISYIPIFKQKDLTWKHMKFEFFLYFVYLVLREKINESDYGTKGAQSFIYLLRIWNP